MCRKCSHCLFRTAGEAQYDVYYVDGEPDPYYEGGGEGAGSEGLAGGEEGAEGKAEGGELPPEEAVFEEVLALRLQVRGTFGRAALLGGRGIAARGMPRRWSRCRMQTAHCQLRDCSSCDAFSTTGSRTGLSTPSQPHSTSPWAHTAHPTPCVTAAALTRACVNPHLTHTPAPAAARPGL